NRSTSAGTLWILRYLIDRDCYGPSSRVRDSAKSARCQPASPSKVARTDEAALRHRKQTEASPMTVKKPRAADQRTTVKKQKYNAIFEEVEKFEDLAPRMQELLLTEPKGTRIYLRVRDVRTIN